MASPATARPSLPTGTVTFLFTDVEGSTKLLNAHPDAYRLAIRRHHELLLEAVHLAGGAVFETVGDAVYAAFGKPTDAVKAAVWAQLALHNEEWGDTPIKVRMGIHLGEVEVQHADGRDHYFGAPLYRCARITSTGHGGQMILSDVTADLVREALPPDIELTDLGEHRLKDLQRPERLYQLDHPDLPHHHPSLRTLDTLPNNLPLQLTSFVGRERELAEVRTLLGETRLLTFAGTGGCGKTRLALQAAADALEDFPDGVWFAELAALTDANQVAPAAATAVGITLEPGSPPETQLAHALRGKRLLLVLDNCEHVVGECARLADHLLRGCPGVRILATSREALGIAGERAWRVPSLPVPPLDLGQRQLDSAEVARLAEYEAVRLFADRAGAVNPDFAVTRDNAAAIAQICWRLDGIPLAIELAAARVNVLAAEQISERLDDAFRLLTGGSRTALPRQQTLRALVDWSYGLLDDRERSVFRAASVFMGGFTLEAAEHVCAVAAVERWHVLDLLTRLVEKSLVLMETRGHAARYRLLETIRLYGRERLVDAREAETARDRHLEWCLHLVQGTEGRLPVEQTTYATGYRIGTPTIPTASKWVVENANLRAALEWARDRDADAGVRLALWLNYAWPLSNLLPRPGERLAELARGLPEGSKLRAWGMLLAATVYRMCGELDAARECAAECDAAFAAAGDRLGGAILDELRALIACAEGNRDGAQALLERGLAVLRELGHTQTNVALRNLGLNAIGRRDFGRARAAFDESLAHARAVGHDTFRASFLRANVSRLEGDLEGARAAMQELRRISGPGGVAVLGGLGDIARAQGDFALARTYYEQLPGVSGGNMAPAWNGVYVCYMGLMAVQRGQYERGVRLLAAVPDTTRAIMRMHMPDIELDFQDSAHAARQAFGDAAFETAWSTGRALSLEGALSLARQETDVTEAAHT